MIPRLRFVGLTLFRATSPTPDGGRVHVYGHSPGKVRALLRRAVRRSRFKRRSPCERLAFGYILARATPWTDSVDVVSP